MNTQEWALIAFTILTEMSVGAFLVLGVVHFSVRRKAGEQEADRMTDRVLIAIGVTLGLGFLASLFHLGTPLNAPKAVVNFATSWLSREILLGVIFAVLGGIFVALQWFKKGSIALRSVVAWLAALVGLAFVYSQAQIYMLDTQPSWNLATTPIFFFVTTSLLGVLAIGAALVANYAFIQRKYPDSENIQMEQMRNVIRWLAIASIFLVGVEFVLTPVYLTALGTGSATAQASLGLIADVYTWAFILRMVLGFIGAVVLAAFLYQNAASSGRKFLGALAYAAFACVLIAEVLARSVFYAAHLGIGI
jgi:anaerobic dimethyl sulfoxide reductase subunit C (anchor subunit)